MKFKSTTRTYRRLIGEIKSNAAKRVLYVLTIIPVVGTLGLTSLPQISQQEPDWISALSGPIFRLYFINNVSQESYLSPDKGNSDIDEDNSNIDDFRVESFKRFQGQFWIAHPRLLTNHFINKHWEIFIDTGRYSPYISFFASLPLRSPPLFS